MKKPPEVKSDRSSPYTLFKFRDINKYSIDSLIMGTLYFSSPNKLNDPFDCKLDIIKAIENAAKYLSKQGSPKDSENLHYLLGNIILFDKLQRKIDSVGVCSFSLKLNDALLWAHYSNKHKGMSILYDFPEAFLIDGNKFIGISKVSYKKNPLRDWFISIANQLPMQNDDLAVELVKNILTAKSPNWRYEKEARIIGWNPGVLKIEKTFIKQICFGLETPNEDISLIKEITSHYKEEVKLYKAIRASGDFGIRFKKI